MFKFQSLKSKISNGKDELNMEKDAVTIDGPIEELQKPFKVQYRMGQVENFSVETTEAVWVTNIKRSVAGILQLDLTSLDSQVAFHSVEVRFYILHIISYIIILYD